jgi:endonuclease YncB( thermonuclease family)
VSSRGPFLGGVTQTCPAARICLPSETAAMVALDPETIPTEILGNRIRWDGNMIRKLLLAGMAIWAVQAQAGQISGQAKAIDSTTIQIGDQRIMLFGIDSVMRKQLCSLDGKPWQCWPAAVKDLQSLLDQGPVVCDPVGDPDVYGRLLARCKVNDQSLNEQLVARGFAIARTYESTDYVAAEAAAKEKKLGLWQGEFLPPSSFRRAAGIFIDRP